ncbi:MAG TPA: Gfo/Idh/MocA family oxidoreductase [Chryseosolibacter sp.]|nr:Gfo/Idh/MocA family oxidoreductase [Chryseosolibacter sp.]
MAPSDTVYIAGIGVGGRGNEDLKQSVKHKKAKVVVLCDVDDRMSVDSRKRFPDAKYYKDFREMFDKESKGIDAVTVSTPDHTHTVAAMAAMQRGKHVMVQKPLTWSIAEARLLAETAKKNKIVTQMGNQGASGDDVRRMKEFYDAGLIGEVKHVWAWTNRPVWPQGVPAPTGNVEIPKELDWDLWIGPAEMIPYNPAYVPFNWRGWWRFGTGALGDMACHVLDPFFRILPVNYPNQVECSATTAWKDFFVEGEYYESCPSSSIIHYNFPRTDGKGDITLTWMDGGLLPKRPEELLPDEQMGDWDGGIIMEGTKGKLMGGMWGMNPTLLPTRLMKDVTLPKTSLPRVPDGTDGHYAQWVEAITQGYDKGITSSPFHYAGPFTESILMGNLALRSYNIKTEKGRTPYPGRKKLLWDAKNMKITNFDEANQFVQRKYRDGWTV